MHQEILSSYYTHARIILLELIQHHNSGIRFQNLLRYINKYSKYFRNFITSLHQLLYRNAVISLSLIWLIKDLLPEIRIVTHMQFESLFLMGTGFVYHSHSPKTWAFMVNVPVRSQLSQKIKRRRLQLI